MSIKQHPAAIFENRIAMMKTGRYPAALLGLLLCLTLLAGCDDNRGTAAGQRPPAISGTALDGEYVSLGRMKGKVVLLCFVASCCNDLMMQLEPLYGRYRDSGLEVLAISSADTPEAVREFVRQNGLTFRILLDDHALYFRQYGLVGYPSLFIIDRSGVIRDRIFGDVLTAQVELRVKLYL
jgi:peroxiredoxin